MNPCCNPIVIVSPTICRLLSVFINVGAITLYPFIISREPLSDVVLNHEKIHLRQQRELFVLGFYALYVWYWGKSLAKGLGSSEAYYKIPFEREAYAYDEDMSYIENREPFAWRKYIN